MFSLIAIFRGLLLSTNLFVTRNYFVAFVLSILKQKTILEIHDTLEIEGRFVKILQKKWGLKTHNSNGPTKNVWKTM